MTFDELYVKLAKASLAGQLDEVKSKIDKGEKHNLDCLINTKGHPIIINTSDTQCECDDHKCISVCIFNAIKIVDGQVTVSQEDCVGCSACVDVCEEKKLTTNKELIEVIEKLKSKSAPVYALVAPAITGQFGDSATIGKLRTALKSLGFKGVVEVATFADILTLREAIEFSHMTDKEHNYQLTSCCCPMWIGMIRKVFDKLSTHLTPGVSPMIAAGRCVKRLNEDAVTVFISPCIAKRGEARESDLVGAIDNVLTFAELKDLFEFANINIEDYEEEEKEHSSYSGRIYAKTGGVSDAVTKSYERITDGKGKPLVSKQAHGIPACRAMLNDIIEGKVSANFYEGMGCVGGCVSGPKTVRPYQETQKLVEEYAEQAEYTVPIDNPYVVKILAELGFHNIEDLLNDKDILCRKF